MTIKQMLIKGEKYEERICKDKIKMAMRAYTAKGGKLYRRSQDYFNMKLYY